MVSQGNRTLPVFNQADIKQFNYVMDRCASMPRKEGPNFESRFEDAELESWRILFKQGKAFSIAIVSPDGKIIAGAFGYVNRENGIIHGESVFYPISLRVDVLKRSALEIESRELIWDSKKLQYVSGDYEEIRKYFEEANKNGDLTNIVFMGGQIDLARVLVLSLGERAHSAGAKFMDAGTVTEFTDSMKGVLLNNEDWKALVAEARVYGLKNIDLASTYDLSEEARALPLIEESFLNSYFAPFIEETQNVMERARSLKYLLEEEEKQALDLVLKQMEGTIAKWNSDGGVPSMLVYRQITPMLDKLNFLLNGDPEKKSQNILVLKYKKPKNSNELNEHEELK